MLNWKKEYSFKQLFGINQINYPLNPTKNEIRNVILGKNKVSNGKSINAAATYFRRNERAGSLVGNPDIRKAKEQEILRSYITQKALWVKIDYSKRVGPGGKEHKVYRYDKETIIKTNNLYYYNSWKDYFNSLLLHNYFFKDTAYNLIGFTEEISKILPVVKQEFIQATEITKIEEIRKFASDNGFTSDEDHAFNYVNKELGITLEDLHIRNVLTRENPKTKEKVLHFIDTIFHTLPSLYD